MVKRNLDGMFFRIDRGNGFENICWTDLTPEERDQVSAGWSVDNWKQCATFLTEVITSIGTQLDLYADLGEE